MKFIDLVKRFIKLYNGKNVPQKAAALSYHLTMTLFPFIIVLYSLLGFKADDAMRILKVFGSFMATETAETISDFLKYVVENSSRMMFIAAIVVFLTSATASARTLQKCAGDIQGGQRFTGIWLHVAALVISILVTVAVYFAILVMFSGKTLFDKLNQLLPFINLYETWIYLRFIALLGIEFFIFWAIMFVTKKKGSSYETWPGALLTTAAMVGISLVFSIFISASVKYPLVYGSIASIILLMFWLYSSSMALYGGIMLNLILGEMNENAPGKSKGGRKKIKPRRMHKHIGKSDSYKFVNIDNE